MTVKGIYIEHAIEKKSTNPRNWESQSNQIQSEMVEDQEAIPSREVGSTSGGENPNDGDENNCGLIETIYEQLGYAVSYKDALVRLYAVNKLLRSEGVAAPNEDSLSNVRTLYEAIGRPLDSIPVVHVGGTNGKVSIEISYMP